MKKSNLKTTKSKAFKHSVSAKLNKRAVGAGALMGLVSVMVVIVVVIILAGNIRSNAKNVNDLKKCGNMPGTYCSADAECASPLDQHMSALDGDCEEKDDEKNFCCYTTREVEPTEPDTISFSIFESGGAGDEIIPGNALKYSEGDYKLIAAIIEPNNYRKCKITADGSAAGPQIPTVCTEDKPVVLELNGLTKGTTYNIKLEIYSDSDVIMRSISAKIEIIE